MTLLHFLDYLFDAAGESRTLLIGIELLLKVENGFLLFHSSLKIVSVLLSERLKGFTEGENLLVLDFHLFHEVIRVVL